MRAVVVGAVESTRIAIETIAAAPGWDLAAVVTLPLALSRRHSDFVDVRPFARAAGAELIEAPDGNAPEIIARLREIAADYTFVIGWSQICRAEFRAAAGGLVGYHPAPLPRLRGRAVIPWTILLDEKISGSTLFWIDEGVDSGPILAQQFFHVAPDETAASLYARHMEALGAILEEALAAIASGSPPRRVQNAAHATWAARRTPADGEIDWNLPAAEILRLVRATTHPYPGAWTALKGEKLVIWRASLSPNGERHAARPGQIVEMAGGNLAIACGDGALLAKEWSTDAEAALKMHIRLGGPLSASRERE